MASSLSDYMSDYVREAATLILNFDDMHLNYETFEFSVKDVEKWWVLGSNSTTGTHLLEGHMFERFPFSSSVISDALKHLETIRCIAPSTGGRFRFLKQDALDGRDADNLGVVELHRVFQEIGERTKTIPKVDIRQYHQWQKDTETLITFTTNVKHEPVELPKMTQFKDCRRGYISRYQNKQTHETIYSFPIPYASMQFPFPVHSNKLIYLDDEEED